MTDARFEQGMELYRRLTSEGTPSPAEALADVAPYLGRLTVYGVGDILNRPGLDLRTREIATVCMLAALGGCEPQLEFHIAGALRAGVAPQEIVEALTQVSGYAGFPRALNAVAVARTVFDAHGVTDAAGPSPRAVVIAYLDAFEAGDLERALALVADDVEWVVPGDRTVLAWAGTWHGRDEVRTFLELLTGESEPQRFDYDEPLPYADRVVVPGTFAYRFPARGTAYAGDFIIDFRVTDGLITRYQMHEDSWGLAKAYLGS